MTKQAKTSLAHAAARYADMSLAVLPLKARGKVPLIKGGSKSATAETEQIVAWWGHYPESNIGIATGSKSDGLIVIDIDVDAERGEDGMATVRAWMREHGRLPETVCARTGRGGLHLYYWTDVEVRNSANVEAGVDVRGEGGYVMAPPSVHPNGTAYEWIKSFKDIVIARADENVMAFIESVRPKAQVAVESGGVTGGVQTLKFALPEAIGAGERNDTLFRYASSLQARGFSDLEILVQLQSVNAMRCKPPLSEGDLETICGSVCGRYEKGSSKVEGRSFRKLSAKGEATGPLLHYKLARALIDEQRCCRVDGAIALWDGERYKAGYEGVEIAILDLVPDAKINECREVTHYLERKAPRVAAADARLIACKGGVLDIEAMELVPAADAVITNVVPHAWNADAYDEHMDKFLDGVAGGNAIVRANLEEVAGMCMYRSNEFGQCPVLIGSGSNGKSTFVRALHAMLGEDNVSTLDIGVVGQRFQTAQLMGMLANLGDDISNERLNGDVLAVFKKVVTGEWIYTDVKNKDGFKFKPFCTLVFSCNEFPKLGDSSDGMLRRLFPIPFERQFKRTDKDYDVKILDKLTTESALQYLMRLGVEGLHRLAANNGFTPNERSEEIVDEVRLDNDSVLQWLDSMEYTAFDLDHKVIEEMHTKYRDWCREGNQYPFGRTKFTRKVNATLGTKSDSRLVPYSTGRKKKRVFVATVSDVDE